MCRSPLIIFVLGALVATGGTVGVASHRAFSDRPSSSEPQARDSVVAEIKKLEQQRLDAGVRKDLAFYADATADDYMQIDWDGKILDKPATLERIKSSYAKLTANTADEMVVRVFGDTAVLTALAHPKGDLDGQDFGGAVRYTRVYVKRNGRWQVTHFQQTRVVASK